MNPVTEHISKSEPEFVFDWKERTGRPYLADLLSAPHLYDSRFTGPDMDLIDEWVLSEIGRRGLNGKTEAYREIIDDLSAKLQISPSATPETKIKTLVTILRKAVEQNRLYRKLGIDLKSLEDLLEEDNPIPV